MIAMTTGVKRGRTGCITCRIRRVRCDEAKPECNRCKSIGRTCDGYSSLPFSRRDLSAASKSEYRKSPSPEGAYDTGPLSRLVTDPAFSDVLEKRYFQFFRQRTVASTNSLVAAHFWDRTVLQACHTVPAIKHAILALSSWHQFSNDNSEQRHRNYGDKQYQLALEQARDLLSTADSQDIYKVLIACIVFICYEGVRGNYKASQLHMDNGRAIARQHVNRLRQTTRRNDLVEIQQALGRLDIPAMTFSDLSSPYHYNLQDFLETDPVLMPWDFKDVYEARTTLFDITRWMLILGNEVDKAYFDKDIGLLSRLQAEKRTCSKRLDRWYEHFEKVTSTADMSARLLILNLHQFYHCLLAISKAELFGPESRTDAVDYHFEEIVRLSEEIVQKLIKFDGTSFSYDIGYIMTVFLAAQRCRDPSIRRRAVQVLRAVPRQEGIWASIPAAAIAQRWIEIEEEGLGAVRCAADVPEVRRIRYIDTTVHTMERKADVVFVMMSEDGSSLTQRHEQLEWKNPGSP